MFVLQNLRPRIVFTQCTTYSTLQLANFTNFGFVNCNSDQMEQAAGVFNSFGKNLLLNLFITLHDPKCQFNVLLVDQLTQGLKPRAHDKGSTGKRSTDASPPSLGAVKC